MISSRRDDAGPHVPHGVRRNQHHLLVAAGGTEGGQSDVEPRASQEGGGVEGAAGPAHGHTLHPAAAAAVAHCGAELPCLQAAVARAVSIHANRNTLWGPDIGHLQHKKVKLDKWSSSSSNWAKVANS